MEHQNDNVFYAATKMDWAKSPFHHAFGLRQLLGSAAVVVDEAARLSHQLSQRWTLVQFFGIKKCTNRFSLQKSRHSPGVTREAQTHCLSNWPMQFTVDEMQRVHLLLPIIELGDVLPSPVFERTIRSIPRKIQSEDIVLGLRYKSLKDSDICGIVAACNHGYSLFEDKTSEKRLKQYFS